MQVDISRTRGLETDVGEVCNMSYIYFGDSQTANNNAVWPGSINYPDARSIIYGLSAPVNLAIGGQCTADLAYQVMSQNPDVANRYYHMSGTNDINAYGSGTAALTLHDILLQAQAQWICGNNRVAKTDPSWSFTNVWNTTWPGSLGPEPGAQGRWTNKQGATATTTFDGDSFALCYVMWDGSTTSLAIEVDGVPQGTVSCAPPRTMRTPHNTWGSPGLLYLDGFGVGVHTLKITANIGNYSAFIQFVGDGGGSGVPFTILGIPRSPTIASLVPAYNGRRANTAEILAARGLNVSFSDPAAGLISGDWMSDNSHVNSHATVKIAKALDA